MRDESVWFLGGGETREREGVCKLYVDRCQDTEVVKQMNLSISEHGEVCVDINIVYNYKT